jgi:hypothetical protein
MNYVSYKYISLESFLKCEYNGISFVDIYNLYFINQINGKISAASTTKYMKSRKLDRWKQGAHTTWHEEGGAAAEPFQRSKGQVGINTSK